jgi:UDP-N-acetylglucosamine transferase subunit ALG13
MSDSAEVAEGPALLRQIESVIAAHAGRHPGIIAEAVVEQIAATYLMVPREVHHRELRTNHQERIRRVSHEVYRILAGPQDIDPAREIAARVLKAFRITRREATASATAVEGA